LRIENLVGVCGADFVRIFFGASLDRWLFAPKILVTTDAGDSDVVLPVLSLPVLSASALGQKFLSHGNPPFATLRSTSRQTGPSCLAKKKLIFSLS